MIAQTLEEIAPRNQAARSDRGEQEAIEISRSLSKTVQIDEMFFECKNGRVTYIDLPAFMTQVQQSLDDVSRELRNSFRVERTTTSVGPYKLRYAIERERTVMDAGGPSTGGFRYGLSEWTVEPLTLDRGETLTQALKEKSQFRGLVDSLDPNMTAVTFWVYPDSFELFRGLRDHLYERGHDVAGRPPPGAAIAASRHGRRQGAIVAVATTFSLETPPGFGYRLKFLSPRDMGEANEYP